MKKGIMKRLAFVLAVIFMMTMLLPSAAYAAPEYNGYCAYLVRPKSGRVIIGDSRCCQMSANYSNSASYVATWGGSYYPNANIQILNSGKLSRVKNVVTKTIQAKGYCKVFLFSTVNDYDGGTGYQYAVDCMMKNVNTIYNMTAVYNGKTVHPTIFVVSLVGSKGKSVYRFNDYLKVKIASNSRVKKYMSIRACMKGTNKGYLSDNVHYNTDTQRSIMIYVRKQTA